MGNFWHDYLYVPLLNALMWLYTGPAEGHLGIAVIELTVALRFLLLPFSILEERNRYRFEKINARFEAIQRDFKNDPVMAKEKIRELLKQHKVSYWSKVIVLGTQLLVLILLYQVFMGGIRYSSPAELYSWVIPPAAVNPTFLGYDLSLTHNSLWPGIVAILLFLEIYVEQKQREHLVTKSDVIYLIFFPIFSFLALWLLPIVKSVFILTSMIFTIVVFGLRKALVKTQN